MAGLVGGLVSLPILAATGILPKIAGLDTSFGGISGLVIHLLVSVVIGMTYGLLFRNEAPSIGLGVPWGFLFGLIWWYGAADSFAPDFDWSLRLEGKRDRCSAPLANRTLGLWRSYCIYIPPAGAAL